MTRTAWAMPIACIALAGCGWTGDPGPPPAPVSVTRIVPCPEPVPPPLCTGPPDAAAGTVEALVESAIATRAWGAGCRTEAQAWRESAAACRRALAEDAER